MRQVGVDTKEIIAAAVRQNRLNFPAKLNVSRVEITLDDGSPIIQFEPGQKLKGHAQVINRGRETAILSAAYCVRYWGRKTLSIHDPIIDQQTGCEGIYDGRLLAPGEYITMNFDEVVPNTFTNDQILYYMSWFKYSDAVSPNLFIRYARRFDPGAGRFWIVDDPEYEQE